MGRKTKSLSIDKNEKLVAKTCGELSLRSYYDYFFPLIKNEETAATAILKDNVMKDVIITDDGIISLKTQLNRFSDIKLGSNIEIKLTLSPLFSVQHESWKLFAKDFNIHDRVLKVYDDKNFRRLKLREKNITKQFKETKLLPFTLEILPTSIVTHFYEENLQEDISSLDVLFPSKSKKANLGRRQKIHRFFDKNLRCNEKQTQAIEHILGFSSYPFPYIIFGPPGTGKSSTVAEAIKQVHHHPTNTRILVCAPSNTAVDVVTEKVLNDVSPCSVLHVVAARHKDKYDSKTGPFKESLQIGGNEKKIVRWIVRNMEKSFIILSTSVMGYVVSKMVGKLFTHVFYDEAGFSSEPECLLAIKPHLNHALIVLSGDHYQLGPVVLSQNTFGLTISLMERLMTCDPYYMRGSDHKYNPKYVTKLVDNYRSDFRLLKLPSEIFYDGELVARSLPCLSVTRARENMGYRFPFVFIDVRGDMVRPRNCKSFFNNTEVEIVQKIANKLLAMDDISQKSIGLISPYRPQYMQMGSIMHYCPRMEYGSPELFQGREKDIIIISTARSSNNSKTLGFLTNFKRFNVAITRAKYLCIVVGDSKLLEMDPVWLSLINYIKENGGFITWDNVKTNSLANICDKFSNINI